MRLRDELPYIEHKITAAAADRFDRQNKTGPGLCSARPARAGLKKLVDGCNGKGPQCQMLPTLKYLELVSRYVVLNAGKKETLKEKMKSAAYIIGMLRRARCFVSNASGLTLKAHFMPKQTYEHMVLGSFSCALKLLARTLERYKKLPAELYKSGSNCCEMAFSEVSGQAST